MAGEVLRTAAELLANLPDNTSGLIQAVNTRDVVVSVADAVAFFADDEGAGGYPITIPNAGAGVPVDILSALPVPLFVGNYYALDGNQQFVFDYAGQGITVDPATQRLQTGSVFLEVSKSGGTATEQFTFRGTNAGVQYLPGIVRDLTTTPELVVSNGSRLVFPASDGPFSIDYIPTNAVDLVVHDIRIDLRCTLV